MEKYELLNQVGIAGYSFGLLIDSGEYNDIEFYYAHSVIIHHRDNQYRNSYRSWNCEQNIEEIFKYKDDYKSHNWDSYESNIHASHFIKEVFGYEDKDKFQNLIDSIENLVLNPFLSKPLLKYENPKTLYYLYLGNGKTMFKLIWNDNLPQELTSLEPILDKIITKKDELKKIFQEKFQ